MEIKKELKLRRNELRAYLRCLHKFSNLPETKFIVFAHYRTGGVLLADLLKSHSKIYCDIDIFLPFYHSEFKKILFPLLYINGRCLRPITNVYGCNLKLYQINKLVTKFHGNCENLMFKLYKSGWKIIYLRRNNILNQSVSNLVAHDRNQWHETKGKPLVRSKVYISCEHLIREIKRNEQILAEEKKVLENLPHITLTYEDDLLKADKHQETLDRVFDYLGTDSVPVKTKYLRVSSDQMSDYILNYDQVVDCITKTKYVQFLEY